jgi:hypothetical protein
VNLANRLAVTLLLLAIMVLAVLVAVLPASLAGPAESVAAVAARTQDTGTQLAIAISALVVAALAFVLLVLEWRRPSRRTVVVAKGPGGTAELTSESVALRVKRAAESVAGVREAAPTIRSRGKSIDVLLGLSVDADADLPEKSQEVMDAVRSEAETRMGIPVKSLKVTFKHASGGLRFPSFPSGSSSK